ncbi:MAG: carboxypeptidase regulatory-like domain-containing protein [Bryobacterales bacterium]|nr:carboxypeptidase regulatory-like domain-containing protein [Bryobacterales bacterium]
MRRAHGSTLSTAIFIPAAAFSQPTSQQMSGFVKDRSGVTVASAKVSIRHAGAGQVRPAQVNESGFYVVADFVVGAYEIEAEAEGFKKFIRENGIFAVWCGCVESDAVALGRVRRPCWGQPTGT